MKFALLVALAGCGRLHFGEAAADSRTGDGVTDTLVTDAAPPPFQPWWTSGTRFRARLWTVGDGGDPILAGWRDTQLDTDCISNTAGDGVERCMPSHTSAALYYADSGCTQRLAYVRSSPCGHDLYAYFQDATSQYHALPIGAAYSGMVYANPGCALTSTPSGGQLYVTGAEVAPAMFASTHYSSRLVGSYTHEFRGFGDGSEEDLDVLAFNNGPCQPDGGVASGVTHCKPVSDPVLAAVYSDAGCTQRAYYSAAGAVPSPEFVVDGTALCGPTYGVYQVTAPLAQAQYWTLSPQGCAMQTTGAGTLFTAIEHDPYPTGTVGSDVRRGRLGVLYWTASDGIGMRLATWDHDLARSCYPFIASDGVFRCLPRQPKPVTAFANATCGGATQTIYGDCYGVAPLDGPSYTSCEDGAYTVRSIAPLAATSYDDEATCTSLGAAYDSTGGSELAPAMFAALAEVIE